MATPQDKTPAPEAAAPAAPHQPDALELTRVQTAIVTQIGAWHPDAQRRVLNAAGVRPQQGNNTQRRG